MGIMNRPHSPTETDKRIMALLKGLPHAEPPSELFAKITDQLRPKRPVRRKGIVELLSKTVTIRINYAKSLALAAGLILAFFMGYWSNSGQETLTSKQVSSNWMPRDAVANHFLGMSLLSDGRAKQALVHFERAAQLAPNRSDYQLWLGVAQASLGKPRLERIYYKRALQLAPNNILARLYLGHSLLASRQWIAALQQYEKVLKLDPHQSQAIYNRGLALSQMGRRHAAAGAWRAYLNLEPDGMQAVRAAGRLNADGDFSFRTYNLGKRKLVLTSQDLLNTDSPQNPAYQRLVAVLEHKPDMDLHIVVFIQGNRSLAKRKALEIKDILSKYLPEGSSDRLIPSWFGSGEKVQISGKEYLVKTSVQLIGKPGNLKL
jgi:tetratricopeptide (TPR) repeat protein